MVLPRVSVVMLASNSQAYIAQAIESLLHQTFSAFELIVIDGDSSDDTQRIVEKIAARDSRVVLDRQPRTGIVNARNRGATLARGEYLAWLDADDVALPYRLERQVRYLDTYPQVAALGGTIAITDEFLHPRLRVPYPRQSPEVAPALLEANVLATSAAMLRISAYRDVGGCRPAFRQGAEDYDLWLRISEHHALANLPDLLAQYRTHSRQVSSASVDRFILPTVAAQLSARARRAGRIDLFGEVDHFTYELFMHLEPDSAVVDRAIMRVAASQATFLGLIGQPAPAINLLRWADGTTRSSRIDRQTRARFRLAESFLAWKLRNPAVAARGIAEVAFADPWHIARMCVKAIRARSRRFPLTEPC